MNKDWKKGTAVVSCAYEKDSIGKAGMQRKIREMSRAYQIEKMLSKDKILELYLSIGGNILSSESS